MSEAEDFFDYWAPDEPLCLTHGCSVPGSRFAKPGSGNSRLSKAMDRRSMLPNRSPRSVAEGRRYAVDENRGAVEERF